MSSESSSSSGSRIRQFGLYRTVDARTEEFLRLSRKRQIRQGCACAAVSTAITVTVVVVVFIVYEFSLNSEINLDNSLKSNWFNLINVTGDGHFESSFTKNADPTTLQLLPMLINALKKNVILEKVLEEHSSSSPLTDRKHTTDDFYSNHAFTRNWLKMPTSKLYAIEYKTSPVVYFRSPTKNIELFTKIRKVRDYQRILNYIDKMISEKVYLGSTKPMLKREMYANTQSPNVKFKIQHRNRQNPLKVYHKTDSDLPEKYNPRNGNKNNGSCKCPMNISLLLKKFLDSIQKVLPLSTTKITSDNYSGNNQIILQKPQALKPKNIKKTIMESVSNLVQKTTKIDKENKRNTIKIVPSKTEISPHNNNCSFETAQPSLNATTTIEDAYLINRSPLKSSNALNDKNTQNVRSTTVKNVFHQTYLQDFLFRTTTKPIKTVGTENTEVLITTENTNYYLDKKYTSNLEENTTEISKKIVGSICNNTKYDGELYSTTSDNRKSNFENKLRLIKSKKLVDKRSRRRRVNKKQNKSRELANNNYNEVDQESSRLLKKLNSDLYQLIEQNALVLRLRSEMTTSEAPSFAIKPTETQVINSVPSESQGYSPNDVFPTQNFEFENTDDFDVKLLSPQMISVDDSNLTTTKKTTITWEDLEEDPVTSYKSMIPVDRPVYLEFHRNDWKQEEPTDFDYNINANNYDTP